MTSASEYVVQPGDTLSAIATQNNTTVDQLVSLNNIANPRLIYPGQRLQLRDTRADDSEAFFSELWIRVSDANDVPIPNLKTTVVTDAGEDEHVTNEHGLVPPVQTKKSDEKVHVFVAKIDGGKKKVAELKPPAGVHQVRLQSPKLKADLPLRVHQGGSDHQEAAPLPLQPGEIQHNRDSAGNPVVNCGVECPNKDNLRLGPNAKYRDFILAASARAGIIPQGIAAFCEAEALKIFIPKLDKDGKPVKNKKSHLTVMLNTGEWNPDSYNEGGAGGLTQFLPNTWHVMATASGSFLHDKIQEKCASEHVTQLPSHEILEMRKDPETAILTAGDYAKMNLQDLRGRGYKLDNVADVDKAKLAYCAHHEGARGLSRIVNGTLDDQDAHKLLVAQFRTKYSDGTEKAKKYEKEVGLTGAAAYKKFLFDYIDSKIKPINFACDPSKLKTPKGIEAILNDIKG